MELVAHPDDRHRVEQNLATGDDSGFHYEFRVVRSDGNEILVAVYGEAVLDENGEREVLRGSVQDITERRAAEEALALAAANAEAAAREHSIADQLQRSLLPQTASSSSTSRSRPTTGPASRAPRSAATGTTSSSSAAAAPRWSSAT